MQEFLILSRISSLVANNIKLNNWANLLRGRDAKLWVFYKDCQVAYFKPRQFLMPWLIFFEVIKMKRILKLYNKIYNYISELILEFEGTKTWS